MNELFFFSVWKHRVRDVVFLCELKPNWTLLFLPVTQHSKQWMWVTSDHEELIGADTAMCAVSQSVWWPADCSHYLHWTGANLLIA